MIDIHNHVIYEFDDGPGSRQEALDMLRVAADQGISDVFATSHFSEYITDAQEADYFTKLSLLQSTLVDKQIPITLHSGSELFFHPFLEKTARERRGARLTGEGRYILFELPLYLMPKGVEETLFQLQMSNWQPIVAHPERYSALHDKPHKILKFIQFGGLLQVNAGSVLGEFGRTVQRIAMWLLENEYVHFLGSDAHKPTGRTFKLSDATEALREHLDPDYIRALTGGNAAKIIEGERIEPLTLPEETPSAKGFLSRVRDRLKFI